MSELWVKAGLMKQYRVEDSPMEKIGKVYSYVSGSFEIIGMIVYIGLETDMIVAMVSTLVRSGSGQRSSIYIILGFKIGLVIGAAVYLIFACLKIHGIRVVKNKLLGAYIGFRYGLIAIFMILLIILNALRGFDFIIPILRIFVSQFHKLIPPCNSFT